MILRAITLRAQSRLTDADRLRLIFQTAVGRQHLGLNGPHMRWCQSWPDSSQTKRESDAPQKGGRHD